MNKPSETYLPDVPLDIFNPVVSDLLFPRVQMLMPFFQDKIQILEIFADDQNLEVETEFDQQRASK